MAGQSSKYTPELVKEICERLSKAEPLAVICREEYMPTDDTVRNWMAADDAVLTLIARARAVGHDHLANECLEIADDAKNDYMDTEDNDSVGYRLNGENIQRSKLRIDTRLKLLAKWNPKKYGDRIELAGDVANPLTASLSLQVAFVDSPQSKDDD